MRRAELVMALVMAAFSAYLMWKSTELPIGWIPDEGPGGGAFSFWLAAVMLISCIAILIRWVRRTSPVAQSTEPYMDRQSLVLIAIVAGSLTAMIALIHVVGAYLAVALFLVFYVRFLGRHSWRVTLALAVGTPIFTFFFFDVNLRIFLPKGITEPLFYPLYEIFL
ncbi:MAG: tripartite tricarboxylate transporter TctB family protein [Alphaproteobacteria bacterium]|nr:tripartite tricarboxylate transporter TctB family protein [Alphaproteobacteria bacterium]